MKPEQQLQNAVCQYLKTQYPKVLFMVSPSGIKLTMGQAKNLKRNQNPSKGWPDLFIAHPTTTCENDDWRTLTSWTGMFLELKPEGYQLYKKDGTLRKNEHTENQAEVHKMLHARGYFATFATGFDQAKEIIDAYLK